MISDGCNSRCKQGSSTILRPGLSHQHQQVYLNSMPNLRLWGEFKFLAQSADKGSTQGQCLVLCLGINTEVLEGSTPSVHRMLRVLLLLLLLLLCQVFPPTTSWYGHLIPAVFTAPPQLAHMPPSTCNLLTTTCQPPSANCQLSTANCQNFFFCLKIFFRQTFFLPEISFQHNFFFWQNFFH